MRKNFYLFSVLLLAIGLTTAILSCSKDDDDNSGTVTNTLSDFITPDGAVFHSGDLPTGSAALLSGAVRHNASAVAGGMNPITVTSTQEFSKFFVGVKGRAGYMEYPATLASSQTRLDGDAQDVTFVYNVPVQYSINLSESFTLQISAVNAAGEVTAAYEMQISLVQSQTGALKVTLTFDTPKDVDLHLFTPSGGHIYYGNRGVYTEYGEREMVDGETVTPIQYGLDVDSNPGCTIDNINNENIFIPQELMENGVYEVKVDLYENCDVTIATAWTVVAYYKGRVIRNEFEGKGNPVSGVYPKDAIRGDMTTIMKFTISDAPNTPNAQTRAEGGSVWNNKKYVPIPLTQSAKDKLELLQWEKGY